MDCSGPCPACGGLLAPLPLRQGLAWGCRGCRGILLGAAVLRQAVDGQALAGLWLRGRSRPSPRRCPACSLAMEVAQGIHGRHELDLCRRCLLVWCDPGELEQMPARKADLASPRSTVPAPSGGVDAERAVLDQLGASAGDAVDLILSFDWFSAG